MQNEIKKLLSKGSPVQVSFHGNVFVDGQSPKVVTLGTTITPIYCDGDKVIDIYRKIAINQETKDVLETLYTEHASLLPQDSSSAQIRLAKIVAHRIRAVLGKIDKTLCYQADSKTLLEMVVSLYETDKESMYKDPQDFDYWAWHGIGEDKVKDFQTWYEGLLNDRYHLDHTRIVQKGSSPDLRTDEPTQDVEDVYHHEDEHQVITKQVLKWLDLLGQLGKNPFFGKNETYYQMIESAQELATMIGREGVFDKAVVTHKKAVIEGLSSGSHMYNSDIEHALLHLMAIYREQGLIQSNLFDVPKFSKMVWAVHNNYAKVHKWIATLSQAERSYVVQKTMQHATIKNDKEYGKIRSWILSYDGDFLVFNSEQLQTAYYKELEALMIRDNDMAMMSVANFHEQLKVMVGANWHVYP